MYFEGQLCSFDVTLSYDSNKESFPTYREVSLACNSLFKKWCFQKEKGDENDYIHWQIRGSLHKKAYCNTVLNQLVPKLPGHWSITSNGVHDSGNQFNYCMKVQTRIDGPWTDKEYRPPPALTRQLKNFLQHDMYPWQRSLLDLVKTYNERTLVYIYDPHYNSGKSIMTEYLHYLGLAQSTPGCITQAEDLVQFVMSFPASTCYIFDMPAAMKKEKLHSMYTALEMIKNGFLYDKRYKGVMKYIDRPNIICFANNLPKVDYMAPDRWITYYLTPQKSLVEYDPTEHPFRPSGIQYHISQFDNPG